MKIEEVFAYLCVSDAKAAIAFYRNAFGATEKFRLSDEYPEYGIRSASAIGATPVSIHLHVDNADRMIEQALKAGATLEREAQDAFYGERSGVVRDPFGHRWLIGHHIEDVTTDEMQRRYTALMASGDPGEG